MSGTETPKQYVPLTCHGHSRPVTHISFSKIVGSTEEEFYLVSACKDNNPMLRDGVTGDWIGTFFGHKGAVYQSRLSPDASKAASASADFTVKLWNTHTGEVMQTFQHQHIVRAVAFPPDSNELLATGGMEKRLRIYDIRHLRDDQDPSSTLGESSFNENGLEIGAGIHQGQIKSIVWTHDNNVLVTVADDKRIRWWDLRGNKLVQEKSVQGDVGSCEFSTVTGGLKDLGSGFPILTIAAGKSIYFYGGPDARNLLKIMEMPYAVASAAIHPVQRKVVVSGSSVSDTSVKVYDYDSEQEIDNHKGHHGPIWSISFSPDGKLYATGSEDGTIKMWKNCQGSYGLWKVD